MACYSCGGMLEEDGVNLCPHCEPVHFKKFHASGPAGLREGETAAILSPGYEKIGDEPWKPIDILPQSNPLHVVGREHLDFEQASEASKGNAEGTETLTASIKCLGCDEIVDALLGLCPHCGHDHEFDPDPRLPNPHMDAFMKRVYAGEEGDPIDLASRRASPYKLGKGKLFFETLKYPSGAMMSFAWPGPADLQAKTLPRVVIKDFDRVDDVFPTPPSATGRWATCSPKWKLQLPLPEGIQRLQRMVRQKTRRIIDMDYAMIEARIIGHMLAGNVFLSEEDRIRYTIIAVARKRMSTALYTLAEAKVVEIKVRSRWEEIFTYYSDLDGGKIHIDLESPGGMIGSYFQNQPSAGYYLADQLMRRYRVMSENAIKYGGDMPDYQKFDKRKR